MEAFFQAGRVVPAAGRRRFPTYLFSALLILFAACATPPQTELDRLSQIEPGPSLSPLEVVQIQLGAFSANDESDQGIDIAFRFASPANRMATGPEERFRQLMRSPAYQPMLQAVEISYGNVRVFGRVAQIPVRIEDPAGRAFVYLFVLVRQDEEPCVDCWMTDGVQVLGVLEGPAPQSI